MVKKVIKKIAKKIKGKKKKELTEKEMTLEQIEDLPIDIQKERGFKEGKIVALEEDLEALREKLKPKREKEEIARFLQQKEEEIRLRGTEGTLSLRGLFDVLVGRKKGAKKINLLSYNKKMNFGNLYDITLNPDGRIGIWTSINGMPRQVTAGATLKNIFWNYEGLINSADRGLFELSLNEVGEYAENVFMDEVPSIIVDATGKYNISKVDKKSLIGLLIDKEREINELFKYLGMAESALSKVGHEINLSKLLSKLNTERRKTAETLLTKYAKEGNVMIKNWRDIEGELAEKAHQLFIKNKQIGNLEKVRDSVTKKLEDLQSGTSVESAKQEILSDVNFLIGLLQGKKVTFAKAPVSEGEEEMTPFRKQFEENILLKEKGAR